MVAGFHSSEEVEMAIFEWLRLENPASAAREFLNGY
jgi:hypothetical protein